MMQVILDFGRRHIMDGQVSLRIFGYGLMLVLGFLFSLSLAKWRARRMGESADAMTYVCVLSLIFGVLGARLAFVIQDWKKFIDSPNPLGSILDITSGGLIYYGGLFLAMATVVVYLRAKRLPLRRYLDILAPSVMLGLAFGRMGCLLNGCCYGGLCNANEPLAMQFPMYSQPLLKFDGNPSNPFSQGTNDPSPVYGDQFYHKDAQGNPAPLVHPPRQLVAQIGKGAGNPHPPRYLHRKLDADQLAVVMGTEENAKALWLKAVPLGTMDEEQWQEHLQDWMTLSFSGVDDKWPLRGSECWDEAMWFASSQEPSRGPVLTFDDFWEYCQARKLWLLGTFGLSNTGQLTAAEAKAANQYLQADTIALAEAQHSLAVRPSQALSAAGAALLALLLVLYTRLRTREGQVFAMMLLAYPVLRFFEELIRADNPHNLSLQWSRLILTHNQYTSIAMFAVGVVILVSLRRLPPSCGQAWAQRTGAVAMETGKDQPTRRRSK